MSYRCRRVPIDSRIAAELPRGVGTGPAAPPFAAFWRRIAAILIDWLILASAGAVLGILVVLLSTDTANLYEMGPVGAAISWAYFALFESSPAQATPGKMVAGIKVTEVGGGAISFKRASVRYWCKSLSTLILGVGWVLAAFTPRRQALHDMLAGTVVVRSLELEPMNRHWDPQVAAFRERWDGTRWVHEEHD